MYSKTKNVLYPVSIAERRQELVLEILYFMKYLKFPRLCVFSILSEPRCLGPGPHVKIKLFRFLS